MSLPDSALVERCHEGDASAFEEIVRRYVRQIHGFFRRMGGSADDAQDLLQETFVRAYAGLARPLSGGLRRFDSSHPLRPWLFRIASNLWADHFRRLRGRSWLPLHESSAQAVPADSETRIDIERAVAELPPIYREVLLMRHFHEMSINEISQATGLRANTVRVRLHRARERLRKLLGEQGEP